MTQFAGYNPATPAPHRIIGWYDTALFNYGDNLPAGLYPLSEDEWAARMVAHDWAIDNGNLVHYSPPPPPDVVRRQTLAGYNRLTVDSDDPEIAGTYSIDLLAELGPLARDVGAGFPLPEGATHPVKDIDGKVRQFGKDDLVSLYLALRDLRHHVKTQAEAATPQWPDARVQHQVAQPWRPAWKI